MFILHFDTSQTYLLFLMFHACFIPNATCFNSSLYHFYAFSGTNLLNRCHSASSCFLLSFCFRNSLLEIFSKRHANLPDLFLHGNEAPVRRRSPGGSPGEEAGPRRGQGWPRAATPPSPPGAPLAPLFRL